MQKIIIENKYDIYSITSYLSGLILGVMLYINCSNKFNDLFSNMFDIKSLNFQQELLHLIIQYSVIFLLIVIFSYSIIGEFTLNFIPLLIGVELGLRLSYFYSKYSMKGIGYSLLMIVPQWSFFTLIILLSIKNGLVLSKAINTMCYKEKATVEINLKSQFKSFIIYFALIIILALINSTLTSLLSSIITL